MRLALQVNPALTADQDTASTGFRIFFRNAADQKQAVVAGTTITVAGHAHPAVRIGTLNCQQYLRMIAPIGSEVLGPSEASPTTIYLSVSFVYEGGPEDALVEYVSLMYSTPDRQLRHAAVLARNISVTAASSGLMTLSGSTVPLPSSSSPSLVFHFPPGQPPISLAAVQLDTSHTERPQAPRLDLRHVNDTQISRLSAGPDTSTNWIQGVNATGAPAAIVWAPQPSPPGATGDLHVSVAAQALDTQIASDEPASVTLIASPGSILGLPCGPGTAAIRLPLWSNAATRAGFSIPLANTSNPAVAVIASISSLRLSIEDSTRTESTDRTASAQVTDIGLELPDTTDGLVPPAALDPDFYFTSLHLTEAVASFSFDERRSLAWRLLLDDTIGGGFPNALFDGAWFARSRRQGSAKTQPFVAYLTSDPRSDPHPLVDEQYVMAQAAQLGIDTDTSDSALDILARCHDFRLNPHRMVITADLARAMGQTPDHASVADVLATYIRDPATWVFPPSPLFDPGRFVTTSNPLVAYCSQSNLWATSPCDWFDPDVFCDGDPTKAAAAPLVTYLQQEWLFQRNPHRHFDPRYYALQTPSIWAAHLSPLMHYVSTGQGDPYPGFQRRFHLRDHPDLVFAPLTPVPPPDELPSAAHPPVPRNDEPKRVIIQMTEPKTRNPYFGLLERPFRLAGYDFRYSTDLPAMVDYSRKRSDLLFWFHQLDPFYHGPDGAAPTSARATRLISHLRAIRDSGNRVLLTWHNPVPHDKRYLDIDLALYRALDQCLDGIIVHCDMGRNWIRDICPRVPIATLPHPSYDSHYQVTINRQVARSHLRVPQDAFLFCTFGEMKPYKNARTLIDAWGVYQRTSADRRSQLLMLGKWRSEGRDFLDANLLQNALIVNRIASDSEIALAITAADVCVFTHANIWVSGAAIAAMSLGRPIIVPTGTGISEYVLPGDNGWLFPNGDAAALAATMVDAVASDRLAHMAAINRGVSGDWSPYRLQPRYAAFLTSLG